MLSKEQISRIAIVVNALIDVPLFPESIEQKVFEKAIGMIDEQLDQLLPSSLKDLLEEIKPEDALNRAHTGAFIERLVIALNKRINIPFLGEQQEEKLIRTVVEMIVKAMGSSRSLNALLEHIPA